MKDKYTDQNHYYFINLGLNIDQVKKMEKQIS